MIAKTKTLINLTLGLFLTLSSVYLMGQEKAPNWRDISKTKASNFYEVQKDFNEYWADKTPAKGTGYNVFKRWEAQMIPRIYPSGDLSLPSTNYQNFIDWKANNDRMTQSEGSRSGGWNLVGPPSKPSGFDGGVGRIDFVKVHPNDPNTLFVSATDGGLWKSTDAGNTWSTNTDYLPIIGCSDLVIHPTHPDTMYLATGSWESGERRSAGVLKTYDGGVTWSTTGLTWTPTDNYKIRRLIMNPANPDIMMAVTDGGVFRTTDAWATTVTSPVASLNGNFSLDDIKYKPGSNTTLYASGRNTSTTDICWKSTDTGLTWSAIFTGLPVAADVSRVIINTTAADANYLYLLAGDDNSAFKGLYRSVDSGANFSTMSNSPNILSSEKDASGTDGQASHDLALVVSPTNKDSVSIGGINMWQSANGGVNWTIRAYWLGDDPAFPGMPNQGVSYVHADIQSISYAPGSSSKMYITCDGGISVSNNGGMTWTDISHNLSVSQMTNVGLSASNPYFLITGLQDIGTLRDSSGTWSVINGGDGEDGFVDRTRDSVLISSNPNGSYALSLDYGKNRYDIPTSKNPFSLDSLPKGLLFFSPIVQDPVQEWVLYAGGRDTLYRSDEIIDTNPNENGVWTRAGKPSGTGGIMRLAIAPSNNQTIYTIKEDAVSKTTNGGTSWSNISSGLPVGSVMPSNITVSNVDADKVWVTFSGYNSTNKVFKSTDGGSSWTNITNNLPNLPVNTVVFKNNDTQDAVYIGADIGVYYRDNTMSNWISYDNNLAHSKVTDLEIYYPTELIRAATYGRSLWESKLYNPNTDCSNLVINTNDSGLGSLRRTVECAAPGDTIKFDPSLVGQTISLTTGRIDISKKLYFIQTASTKIKIQANVTGPVFNIAGNTQLWLEQIELVCGTNTKARALLNNGSLILKDVKIFENTPLGSSTISNLGNVTIMENVQVVKL